MRGAEAVLTETEVIGKGALKKERIPKKYRVKELDQALRKERTRAEARLLHKAKLAMVGCPTVLAVDDFSITMSVIVGRRPDMDTKISEGCGLILARLHRADIIHGDFTPANLMIDKKGELFVIDFGLGSVSGDIEDKAVDVFTMLQMIDDEDSKKAFIKGYSGYEKSKTILKRERQVASRVRYAT
jgi:TP53 regulating kinase-like protein